MEKIATFRDRLDEAMKRCHVTQKELSDDTGIAICRLSYYLSGRNGPKHEGLVTLAKALNVDPDWLLGYDVPMQRKREQNLNEKFDMLNEAGKIKAEEYIDDLLDNPKYSKPIIKRRIA